MRLDDHVFPINSEHGGYGITPNPGFEQQMGPTVVPGDDRHLFGQDEFCPAVHRQPFDLAAGTIAF